MLLEWLSREGGIVLSWWLLVTVAGVAALPLCLRVLGGLPDRGYTLARAVGLLLVGFVFWLLASLGFLSNTTGSMALAWLIVLIVALVAYFGVGRERINLRAWWRENNRVVLVGEIIFIVLLFAWAIYRAYQNNLSGTEKSMELAFLSASMRSTIFPPADPWLAGYAISYYYFGYVIMGMLSSLSGISSTVGFNMTTPLLFALTGLSAFGVVYNLVRSHSAKQETSEKPHRRSALLVGLLGMTFVILMGNFSTLLVEIPYQTRSVSPEYLQFWDMNERTTPLEGQGSGNFMDWGNWWWFRASRVLNDFELNGNRQEVIDEFPQFSFLLSDNHPHVLALPFAVLALGLALNTLLLKRRPNVYEIVFYSVCFGGLIFLNTWDGPVYLIVLVAAEGLRRLIARGRLRNRDFVDLVALGLALLILAAIFYLPFLVAFRSQLSGILPNLQYPTLFQQYFLMFGPLLLLLVFFMGIEIWRSGRRMNWRLGLQTGLLLLGGLFALMIILALLAWFIPGAREAVLNFVDANGGWPSVLPALISKRITHIITSLVLTTGLVVIVAWMFPRELPPEPTVEGEVPPQPNARVLYAPETGFAVLLIAAALVLTLVPEFVYLRDVFGTRMNTVFKFYYQGWLMLSVASAYGIYSVFAGKRTAPLALRATYATVAILVIAAGMLYPYFGIQSRMFSSQEYGRTLSYRDTPSLDGGPSVTGNDDYQLALCLGKLVTGTNTVIASAVGGSYRWSAGIVSTYTGIPTVFNWPGHEVQWRGSTYNEVAGSREADINQLYTDPAWNTAQSIITKYGIQYIVFGSEERNRYSGSGAEKFLDNLDVVCELGESRIFHVPERALAQAETQ